MIAESNWTFEQHFLAGLIRWRPVREMVTLASGVEEKRGMAAKKGADSKSKPAVSTLEPVKLQKLPAWAWIVGAVLVIGIIFTGYRTVQTQEHLETVQSQLESSKQATDQAKTENVGLEKRTVSLISELEKANAHNSELQTKLDNATSEGKSVRSQLETSQSRFGATQSELESAKKAIEITMAQAEAVKTQAANLNLELEKANAEIVRLKSELGNAPRAVSPLAAPEGIMVSSFIGATVYSGSDENLGEVKDVLLADSSGQAQAIIDAGEKDVAVDLAQLKIAATSDGLKVLLNATKADLESLPEFKKQ
jgi:cell division protein FtsL